MKPAGAGWINHNLNTSRRFYPEICTTHTWDDRVRTIRKRARGGAFDMLGRNYREGETDDVIDLAYATRRLRADSVQRAN